MVETLEIPGWIQKDFGESYLTEKPEGFYFVDEIAKIRGLSKNRTREICNTKYENDEYERYLVKQVGSKNKMYCYKSKGLEK